MDKPVDDLKVIENPFIELADAGLRAQERDHEEGGGLESEELRRQRREALYSTYSPLVSEVLHQLIAAYRPGVWKQGNDCVHVYCCHINWFAGPAESYKAAYDEHHEIRRRIEVGLELDSSCNPTGFKVTNHENANKCVHVGLSRDDLIDGIKEVFA